MENASKALLMAGGMLIALLVIGALVLMFNQIGDYEKGNQGIKKTSEIAEFNIDFVRYTEGNIKGVDIISLANKVINFNSKNGILNSIDYSKKITLNIDVNDFSKLFGSNSYEIKNYDNDFMKTIKKFSSLENTYTLSKMDELSSNYDSIVNGNKTIGDILGKKYDGKLAVKDIEDYREYSEFKASTFKSKEEPKYHDDGQVKELSFKFVKR